MIETAPGDRTESWRKMSDLADSCNSTSCLEAASFYPTGRRVLWYVPRLDVLGLCFSINDAKRLSGLSYSAFGL